MLLKTKSKILIKKWIYQMDVYIKNTEKWWNGLKGWLVPNFREIKRKSDKYAKGGTRRNSS